MASGAEHYDKAEEMMSSWQTEYRNASRDGDKLKMTVLEELGANVLACAQVHATLALAQATLAATDLVDWDAS